MALEGLAYVEHDFLHAVLVDEDAKPRSELSMLREDVQWLATLVPSLGIEATNGAISHALSQRSRSSWKSTLRTARAAALDQRCRCLHLQVPLKCAFHDGASR